MLKKTCPNGHVYDQSIYGDTCPLCPAPSNDNSRPTTSAPGIPSGNHTKVITPPDRGDSGMPIRPNGMQDPRGETRVAPALNQQIRESNSAPAQSQSTGAKTTIRRNPAMMGAAVKPNEDGRKLVGFLVTYNRTPMGKAYNVYEGRNYIGRDSSCDICIPDDNQMSGKHMLIRYLSGNNKFSFKDEMSSNGTYVNKELVDEGVLQNYDIIRVGSTLFVFIAIPQI